MEPLLLYILKVNGLLILFYLVYKFLLEKETFFQANRWFLVFGILASFCLPFITYSKIIWIEPQPIPEINLENVTGFVQQNTIVEPEKVDWFLLIIAFYTLVTAVFVIKLGFEFISLYRIIRNGKTQKEKNITLIENSTIKSPFSFFNYIVYNTENFSKNELEQIFMHEKVHINQKHTLDVLLVKFVTIALWFNPISWLYQKALLQNLEFIADNKVTQHTDNSYFYQKTVLKTVLNNRQLSISNQFYQSLIKKRIVMLNQQKSNKKNVWKYAVIVPILTALFLLFQVETVAQVKEAKNAEKTAAYAVAIGYSYILEPTTTDKELEELEQIFTNEENAKLKISNVERNKNNEIIGIKLVLTNSDDTNTVYERKSSEPINKIEIYAKEDKNKQMQYGINELEIEHTTRTSFKTVEVHLNKTGTFETHQAKDNITQIKEDKIVNYKKAVIYFNEKEINYNELDTIVPTSIATIVSFSPNDKLELLYGKKAKENGIILITTEDFENKTTDKHLEKTVIPSNYKNKINDETLIIINEKEYTPKQFAKFKVDGLSGKVTYYKGDEAIEKFGEKGKNGVLIFEGKSELIENKESGFGLSFETSKAEENIYETDFKLDEDKSNTFVITKKTETEDLEFYKTTLAKSGAKMKYSGIKRNNKGEINSITINLEKGDSKLQKKIKQNEPINNIYIGFKNGKPYLGNNP